MPTTAFGTSGALGVGLAQTWTDGEDEHDYPPLSVGTRILANDGGSWILVTAGVGGVTGDGYVVFFDDEFVATMLSTSNDVYGSQVGVPQCGAVLEGTVYWVQIAGYCPTVRTAALAAAGVALFASGTAGQIDDGGTASPYIQNMVLSTTQGAAAGLTDAMLNFPMVANYSTPL